MFQARFRRRHLNSRTRRAGIHDQRGRAHRISLEPLEARLMLTGTWTPLASLIPIGGVNRFSLLSDGSVWVPTAGSSVKLTPDATGSYVNGTWSDASPISQPREADSRIILPDGRLFLFGGVDVNNGTILNVGEIYNPTTNSSTSIAPFPESTFGNAPIALLPDGRVLAGSIVGPQTYIYNPATDAWSLGAIKRDNDNSAHETWTVLADGSVLSYDVNANRGHAQRFDPATNSWLDSGTVPVALEAGVSANLNMGPGVVLNDGRVLQLGRSSSTAIYTPSATPGGTGTWTAGPTIPNGLEAGGDHAVGASAAALLPNGKVLFCADKPDSGGPTKFYEFDPAASLSSSLTDVTPSIAGYSTTSSNTSVRLLVLPTGQVLLGYGNAYENFPNQDQLYVYTPDGAPQAAWKPTIASVVANGDHYTLSGTQLNGRSAGASLGVSTQDATNFPIVELKDGSGHVYMARTSNWSKDGIATSSTPVTTDFTLPANMPSGTYSLYVIANGIASSPFSFTGGVAAPAADLAISGTVPGTASVGVNLTYTLTVTNHGFNTATNVAVTDTLDANLQYVSATTSQGAFTQSGGIVTFSLGSLAVGQTITATLTAQALASGTLTNTATVASSAFDADTTNNTAATNLAVDEGTGIPLANTFLLHSDPGAHQRIYLDFVGHTTTGTAWNSSSLPQIVTPPFDLDGNPSSFNDQELLEIQRVWQRVAEDYIPFNVDVTTQDPGTAALSKTSASDTDWGIRVCIGGSWKDWFGSSTGGETIIGSFNDSVDTPSFVFADDPSEKHIAELISHEAGHSLGLSHDGVTNPPQTYYSGSGSGPTGWSPIMGASPMELSQWSKGEYPGANNTQDDLAIITSQNGFGYRVDDHGNDMATASPLTATSATTFTGAGIIEKNTDVDWFSFSVGSGNYGITVDPAVRGPDLDILAKLYDATGNLIATSNPVDALNATFQLTTAGTYYVSVDGTGKGDPLTGGYSDYGSLGQYTINVAPNIVVNAGAAVSGTEDAAVAFVASGSFDPNGSALTFNWDFGDGTTGWSSSPTINHKYLWGGTFTATVSVDDGHGGTGTATTTATIGEVNDPPVANAGAPYGGYKGTALSFSGAGTTDYDNLDGTAANNQSLSYSWNFGDGTTGTGITPSHTYANAGNYTVSLTVSDGVASTTAVTTANVATPSANDMYVWDIAASTQTKGRNTTTSISVVVRRDSNTSGSSGSSDAVVSGANVTVELRTSSGALVGTVSGTTDKNGSFSGNFSNLAAGAYVAEVTSLTHSTYTWNKLLDPTPNDTDLDGDNLPDQQFTVGTAAAGLVAAGPTGFAASAGSTTTDTNSSQPTPLNNSTDTAAIIAPQLKPSIVDQAILAATTTHSRRALDARQFTTSEDSLDDLFALI